MSPSTFDALMHIVVYFVFTTIYRYIKSYIIIIIIIIILIKYERMCKVYDRIDTQIF